MAETIHTFRGRRGDDSVKRVRPVAEFLDSAVGAGLNPWVIASAREDEVEQAWLSAVLDPYTDPWHLEVEVVEDYMPPYPRPETRPSIQVRWRGSFLRQGGSAFNPFFWDMYGKEFLTVQFAWLAVAQAPAPPTLTYSGRKYPCCEGVRRLEADGELRAGWCPNHGLSQP